MTTTENQTINLEEPQVENEAQTETLDVEEFVKFLASIPGERDLLSWLNWLARPTKKIALVGFTQTRNEVPWGDATWEKWICNNLHKMVPDSWDRLYDLHTTAEIHKDKDHERFLRTTTKPVYVFEPQPEWPTAVRYPLEQVNAVFGTYFTNSVSWMIAHAILEGVTDLGVWGVDMATGSEYAAQRPSCEYFLGFAAGRGINVAIPKSSDLLKNIFQYGADDDTPVRAKWTARQAELSERLNMLQQQHGQMTAQINQLQGALEQVKYDQGVWLNPHTGRGEQESQAASDGVS